MAKSSKRKTKIKKNTHGHRHVLIALLFAMVVTGGFFDWMYMCASIVCVCPAEVYLPDLPTEFEGTKLLYVSDVNVRGTSDVRAATRLMNKLKSLQADLLLLGGDYSAGTVLDALNNAKGDGEIYAKEFVRSLVNFQAPLGKYAVLGEADDINALANDFAYAGIDLLVDGIATVSRNGARLGIVGLSDVSLAKTPYNEIARAFRADDCAIVLTHNSLAYTRIRTSEAQGGGAWADMVLSGHTLGGQIKIFGRTFQNFSEEEARRMAGWYYGDDLPVLVSQGIGCKGARLRLGTRNEVWLITLHKPKLQGTAN